MCDRNNSLRFMISWCVAGIIVMPAAYALCSTANVALKTAISEFVDTSLYDFWDDYMIHFIFIGLLITGFCVGILQKGIIRRHFGIDVEQLCLYSVLGSLLAGFAAFFLSSLYSQGGCCYRHSLGTTVAHALQIATYLAMFSAFQTLALRPYLRCTRRWIVAHVGAIALDCAIVMAGRAAFPTPHDDYAIHFNVTVPFLTLFTGLVMLHLCRNHLRADKAKRDEWAPQPLRATDDPPRKPSVWDDAM